MSMSKRPATPNQAPRSITIAEIAAEFALSVEEVVCAAWACGIGVVEGGSKLIDAQAARLRVALAERRPGDLPRVPSGVDKPRDEVRFAWDFDKFSLGPKARRLVPNLRTMAAVERVAVAEQAVCWISRKGERCAIVVLVGSLAVVLGPDIRHGRPAFVITAYDSSRQRYSDQSEYFISGAELVKSVVPIESRLALLPEVRA
jgi:hypothetical protein